LAWPHFPPAQIWIAEIAANWQNIDRIAAF
jgi:hypothetical protein